MLGTVKFFKEDKKFGFIEPDGGGEDVFLHATQIPEPLKRNQRVSFDIGDGKNSRGRMAVNVKVV